MRRAGRHGQGPPPPAPPLPGRRLDRVLQPEVVLLRELRVDGQPDLVDPPLSGPGKPHRELDMVGGTRHGTDVSIELVGRQHLLENAPELHFAPGSPCLDVAEHALQIADPLGQALHLAEAAMHFLQPLADLGEGLAEPLLKRALEFLVHRDPHLLELLLVAGLQLAQLRGLGRSPEGLDGGHQ